jgi:hypothetical protein
MRRSIVPSLPFKKGSLLKVIKKWLKHYFLANKIKIEFIKIVENFFAFSLSENSFFCGFMNEILHHENKIKKKAFSESFRHVALRHLE